MMMTQMTTAMNMRAATTSATMIITDVSTHINTYVERSNRQWRRQGSEVRRQSWSVGSPPPPFPYSPPLLFVPPPFSLLSDISSPPFLFPIFPSQNPPRVWGALQAPPAGSAPAAKAFMPYFETRRRSGCNDFGSFCTYQNIHLNQDRSYWLLPPYTSYDYFSSDLCWSQDQS